MTMASRIGVMEAGRIVQISTPSALYEYPATRFVAEFIGGVNMLTGTVMAQVEDRLTVRCHELEEDIVARYPQPIPVGSDVSIAIRPEKIDAVEVAPAADADNVVSGQVVVSTGWVLLASLLGLAIVEHLIMAYPTPMQKLWGWAMSRSPSSDRLPSSGVSTPTTVPNQPDKAPAA